MSEQVLVRCSTVRARWSLTDLQPWEWHTAVTEPWINRWGHAGQSRLDCTLLAQVLRARSALERVA